MVATKDQELEKEHVRERERSHRAVEVASRPKMEEPAEVYPEPPTPELAQCRDCDAVFTPRIVSLFGKVIVQQVRCFECVEKERLRLEAFAAEGLRASEDARQRAWEAICDHAYRTTAENGATEPQKLRNECPKLECVLAWTYGPKSLLLAGETGKCKTRAAWRLLRTLFDRGMTIRAFTAGEFGRQYASACMSAEGINRKGWFDDLVSADIVFLDDLGKSEWSPGVWGEFFDLIETRTRKGRPLIITSNETGKTLEAKAKDPNTWGPLYRRIAEFPKITF